jgi:hypothetical protein
VRSLAIRRRPPLGRVAEGTVTWMLDAPAAASVAQVCVSRVFGALLGRRSGGASISRHERPAIAARLANRIDRPNREIESAG